MHVPERLIFNALTTFRGFFMKSKQLRKSKTDKLIFGVCGGIGEHFNIDADIVRFLWVFVLPIGLFAYLIADAIIPDAKYNGSANFGRPKNALRP